MNEAQRHSKLIEFLENNTFINIRDCAQLLDVSLSTAKRDITRLALEGRLKKIRNGAESLANASSLNQRHVPEQFFPDLNRIKFCQQKRRIAKAAASLCEDSDSIVISGGNTTYLMGDYLADKNIQVITNFMPLAYKLIIQGNSKLIMFGGQYLPERYITISTDDEIFKNHASRFVFFTGTSAAKNGVYTSDLLVYMAEKKLLNYGDRIIALMDSSKIGKHGGKLLVSASQLDTLITDKQADSKVLSELEKQGVNIILV